MATPQSPFSFLDGIFERVAAGPQPPQWLVHEVQQRMVLFLNHVLMQEKEAMDRLVRQKGRVARVQWRAYSLALVVTPAGLFNVSPDTATPDLRLEVTQTSPFTLAQDVLRGDKPAIRIEGDVQLAAEINWLVDHVRWDVEDDLARVIGDAPAHTVAQLAGRAAQALRQFVGSRMAANDVAPAPAPSPAPFVPATPAPFAAPAAAPRVDISAASAPLSPTGGADRADA
ncbi:hypothetical protein [Acidovorax radicis]|jgi:ubiquinone biosynthesis protein UbiJ|uniref:hypothetical protein n=1 Tax=Acidovorax radicis TaxID=758826 RepID=UPI001CF87F09|nr:hypothetical protein [Acidovorax radicis]UCU98415.1 hypothetical protein KI609_18155 [Acidovorax radicis]